MLPVSPDCSLCCGFVAAVGGPTAISGRFLRLMALSLGVGWRSLVDRRCIRFFEELLVAALGSVWPWTPVAQRFWHSSMLAPPSRSALCCQAHGFTASLLALTSTSTCFPRAPSSSAEPFFRRGSARSSADSVFGSLGAARPGAHGMCPPLARSWRRLGRRAVSLQARRKQFRSTTGTSSSSRPTSFWLRRA